MDIGGLRVGHGAAAATSRPQGSLAADTQPVLSNTLAAQRGSAASILDGFQVTWEGGSSAAAIPGIAAAPTSESHRRSSPFPGKALALLAGTAAAIATKSHRQQSQRPVSRLHAASYPAAPTGTGPTGSESSAQASAGWEAQPGAPALQHSLSSITDTLHAAAQLQHEVSVPQVADSAGSSTGSTGRSAAAGVAQGLQGSRLGMWQRQPRMEPGRQQLSVGGELRASITGALRCVTGAVRCGGGTKLQQPVAHALSPGAPLLSPADAAEVVLTPEAADSSTDDGGSMLSSSSCSSCSAVADSLADTAHSALSYALQPHSMGLSRGTPFVGPEHGDSDDYVL